MKHYGLPMETWVRVSRLTCQDVDEEQVWKSPTTTSTST